jgi:hypothetical protein
MSTGNETPVFVAPAQHEDLSLLLKRAASCSRPAAAVQPPANLLPSDAAALASLQDMVHDVERLYLAFGFMFVGHVGTLGSAVLAFCCLPYLKGKEDELRWPLWHQDLEEPHLRSDGD